MKRFIRVVALCIVFVSVFTCFASASEVNGPYINVIDYQTSRIGTLNSSNPYFYVKTPYMAMFYVDFVFSVEGTFTGVYDEKLGSGSPLTVINLGRNTYRVYGSVHGGWRDQIQLHFTGLSGNVYFTLINAYVSGLRTSRFDSILRFSLDWYSYDDVTHSLSGVMPGTNVNYTSPSFGSDRYYDNSVHYPPERYSLTIRDDNWRNYDFLDFHFQLRCNSIDSISCTIGDLYLPATVTFVDVDAGRTILSMTSSIDSSGFTEFNWEDNINFTRVDVLVHLDLRGVDRNSTFYPKVKIHGLLANDALNYVRLINSVGSIEYQETNILASLLRGIQDKLFSFAAQIQQSQDAYHADIQAWQQAHDQLLIDKFDIIVQSIAEQTSSFRTGLTNLQSAVVNKLSSFQLSSESWFTTISNQLDELIHPDTSGSEKFEDDIASQATEMEDISETLDSVTKPPVDDFDVSIDEYFTGQDTTAFASPLSAFFENSIFIVMFLMSMIAVTVSYVFYGKR